MLRHTAGRAYDELAWLAERGPLRTHGTRPVVRDIGYYEARPGAVEAFARVGAGDQLRAMAFRLERGQDLRWRCTAVEPRRPTPTAPDRRLGQACRSDQAGRDAQFIPADPSGPGARCRRPQEGVDAERRQPMTTPQMRVPDPLGSA